MGIGRRTVCFSIVIIASVLGVSQMVNIPLVDATNGKETVPLFVADFQSSAFSILGVLVLAGGGAFGALYYSCNKK